MATGQGSLLIEITSAAYPPPTDQVAELPGALDDFFERALAKAPDDRFQSARELALALADVADISISHGISSGPPSSHAPQWLGAKGEGKANLGPVSDSSSGVRVTDSDVLTRVERRPYSDDESTLSAATRGVDNEGNAKRRARWLVGVVALALGGGLAVAMLFASTRVLTATSFTNSFEIPSSPAAVAVPRVSDLAAPTGTAKPTAASDRSKMPKSVAPSAPSSTAKPALTASAMAKPPNSADQVPFLMKDR